MLSELSPEQLQSRADEIAWFHTIDLGRGVVTKGASVLNLGPSDLPPLSGRSVLDIGAWDGRYSFMAEREGASRVVALDHYAWGIDFGAREAYWRECAERGELPDHHRDVTDFWLPDLPGRRGFDFAHEALQSSVEPVVADFATVDLDELGTFDVVLFFGVLYHMQEPLTALKRVRVLTTKVAAIETEAMHLPMQTEKSFMEFHAGNELGNDFGNWYVPSIEALKSLCFAAGFSRTEVIRGAPVGQHVQSQPRPSAVTRLRHVVRPVPPTPPAVPPIVRFRALVHAYV